MSPPFATADIVPIIIINQDKKNNRTLRICRDLMPPNRLCYQSTNRIHKIKRRENSNNDKNRIVGSIFNIFLSMQRLRPMIQF